ASSIGHRRAVRCPLFPYTTLFRSRLTYFYQLLRSAGIDAGLTEEIEPVIWTKFLFISSAAASTCYFNATFGQIRSNRDFFDTFLALLDEGIDLALKMNVRLNLGTKENIIGMLMATPIDADRKST